MRVPVPPAGTTATALVIATRKRGGSSGRLLVLEPGEDHAAGRGLQHRGDGGGDRLADVAFAVVDDHHGAVVEIGHALTNLLALLHDVDVHDLAGQDDRLEGVGQLVDVEHGDPGELSDFPSSISFRSTSRIWGKSWSSTCTLVPGIRCTRWSTSKPRLPRLRLRGSGESAICWSSRRTNCGMIRVPSRKPASQRSTMRPSMITEVSRILNDSRRAVVFGKSFADMSSSSSRLARATEAPRYVKSRPKRLRPSGPASGETAPMAVPSPSPRPRPRMPPIDPQKMRSTGIFRACHSRRTASTPKRKPAPASQ